MIEQLNNVSIEEKGFQCCQRDSKSSYDLTNFIDFALLFGSYASKRYTTLSDIDIAIYLNHPISLIEQGDIISLLEERLENRVVLIILNGLERDNPKMAFNIIDNHIVIFNGDEEKYIDFKADIYKCYFDLLSMYEMFDMSLKERLKDGTYEKA